MEILLIFLVFVWVGFFGRNFGEISGGDFWVFLEGIFGCLWGVESGGKGAFLWGSVHGRGRTSEQCDERGIGVGAGLPVDQKGWAF